MHEGDEPNSGDLALELFLVEFDKISARGFVPTLRAGSTGIGFTLETLLKLKENNSPGGDWYGMEIKAFRETEIGLEGSEKMNLFLKEPEWTDGLEAAERVRQYGYVDENARTALYSTVTRDVSSHGFSLRVEKATNRTVLLYRDREVAFWAAEMLHKRLMEKHSSTVFVSARTRGEGSDEEFHYYGVTWCSEPSLEAFLALIEQGDVMLELRMHVEPDGSVRNHGSCFRIARNRIRDLYEVVRQLRPASATGASSRN